MRLGVDSYSLRWQGWDAFELLEYSARLGLDNVHLSERGNLASLDEDYLLRLKARAEELGLAVEIGMGSFEKHSSAFKPELGSGEQQLSDMLRAAKVVGSPIVRCLIGGVAERLGPVPFQQHFDEAVRTLKAVSPLARDLGIKLAVENHGALDLLARELKALVEEVGFETVGVCLDTGNPAYAAEDPVQTAEILAPLAISSHFRDTKVWAVAEGAMAQWAPLGQGNVDLRRIVAILRDKAPNVPVDLEIITSIPATKLEYWVPDSRFWRAYPEMLASDFARFVKLAESGTPGELQQEVIAPGTRGLPSGKEGERLIDQQRLHFEESVRYARDVLGLGERGR